MARFTRFCTEPSCNIMVEWLASHNMVFYMLVVWRRFPLNMVGVILNLGIWILYPLYIIASLWVACDLLLPLHCGHLQVHIHIDRNSSPLSSHRVATTTQLSKGTSTSTTLIAGVKRVYVCLGNEPLPKSTYIYELGLTWELSPTNNNSKSIKLLFRVSWSKIYKSNIKSTVVVSLKNHIRHSIYDVFIDYPS